MNKKIIEFRLDNEDHLAKFRRFYDDVFSKSFVRDEIGSIQAYIDLVKCSSEDTGVYNLFFTEIDDKFVACHIFDQFPKIECTAAEFSCIDPLYRGKGLSTELMREAYSRKKIGKWLFGEIEKDNLINQKIWGKFGFKLIPVNYTQLPLGSDRGIVDKLLLCVKPLCNSRTSIPSDTVKKFVWYYYKYSQFCDDPDANAQYLELSKKCDSVKAFDLLEFGQLNSLGD